MDSIYIPWTKTAEEIVQKNLKDWKRLQEVQSMLEHVSVLFATTYIHLCIEEQKISIEKIRLYAFLCDCIGNPMQHNFKEYNLVCSPTCIRYLYHASLILNSYNNLPIVEIGGGYGGLALAIDFLAKDRQIQIPKYTIIDLPSIQKLQQYYLQEYTLGFPVMYEFQQEEHFFISNYALAEMEEVNRKKYIQDIILPYAKKGFMAWNSSEDTSWLDHEYNFTKKQEFPKTGPFNTIIEFQK